MSRLAAIAFATIAMSALQVLRKRRPPWGHGIPLDDGGLVFLFPDFLSSDEVDAILQHGEDGAAATLFLMSERYEHVEFDEKFRAQLHGKADELVATVERRVAEITGIEPHAQESALMLSVSRPWKRKYEGDCLDCATASTLQNLHHDQNNGPGRVATVLIYLSGGDDSDDQPMRGGETFFPCLRRAADGAATTSDDELCRRMKAGYERGERILWPRFYS